MIRFLPWVALPMFALWGAGTEIVQEAAGYIIARQHYERMWLANHAQHAYERCKLGITEPRDG